MVIERSERVGRPTVHRCSRIKHSKNPGRLTISHSFDITALCPLRSPLEKVFLDYAWDGHYRWVEVAVCRFGYHFGWHPIFGVDGLVWDIADGDFPSVAERLGLDRFALVRLIDRLAPQYN